MPPKGSGGSKKSDPNKDDALKEEAKRKKEEEEAKGLFNQVAASQAYPHVENWFHEHAKAYDEKSEALAAERRQLEEANIPEVYTAIHDIRAAHTKERNKYLNSIHAVQHLQRDNRHLFDLWQADVAELMASYLDGWTDTITCMEGRRQKAEAWEKGEKQVILDRLARFEQRRAELRARRGEEEVRYQKQEEREQMRLKLAFESCLAEVREVLSWQLAQPSGSSQDSMRRRRLHVLSIIGEAGVQDIRDEVARRRGDFSEASLEAIDELLGLQGEGEAAHRHLARLAQEEAAAPVAGSDEELEAQERQLKERLQAHLRDKKKGKTNKKSCSTTAASGPSKKGKVKGEDPMGSPFDITSATTNEMPPSGSPGTTGTPQSSPAPRFVNLQLQHDSEATSSSITTGPTSHKKNNNNNNSNHNHNNNNNASASGDRRHLDSNAPVSDDANDADNGNNGEEEEDVGDDDEEEEEEGNAFYASASSSSKHQKNSPDPKTNKLGELFQQLESVEAKHHIRNMDSKNYRLAASNYYYNTNSANTSVPPGGTAGASHVGNPNAAPVRGATALPPVQQQRRIAGGTTSPSPASTFPINITEIIIPVKHKKKRINKDGEEVIEEEEEEDLSASKKPQQQQKKRETASSPGSPGLMASPSASTYQFKNKINIDNAITTVSVSSQHSNAYANATTMVNGNNYSSMAAAATIARLHSSNNNNNVSTSEGEDNNNNNNNNFGGSKKGPKKSRAVLVKQEAQQLQQAKHKLSPSRQTRNDERFTEEDEGTNANPSPVPFAPSLPLPSEATATEGMPLSNTNSPSYTNTTATALSPATAATPTPGAGATTTTGNHNSKTKPASRTAKGGGGALQGVSSERIAQMVADLSSEMKTYEDEKGQQEETANMLLTELSDLTNQSAQCLIDNVHLERDRADLAAQVEANQNKILLLQARQRPASTAATTGALVTTTGTKRNNTNAAGTKTITAGARTITPAAKSNALVSYTATDSGNRAMVLSAEPQYTAINTVSQRRTNPTNSAVTVTQRKDDQLHQQTLNDRAALEEEQKQWLAYLQNLIATKKEELDAQQKELQTVRQELEHQETFMRNVQTYWRRNSAVFKHIVGDTHGTLKKPPNQPKSKEQVSLETGVVTPIEALGLTSPSDVAEFINSVFETVA